MRLISQNPDTGRGAKAKVHPYKKTSEKRSCIISSFNHVKLEFRLVVCLLESALLFLEQNPKIRKAKKEVEYFESCLRTI